MVTQTSTRRVDPGITVVEIAGRLALGNTLHSLEISIRRLIQEGAHKLAIDLSGLTYIDSAAIGVLLGCFGEMDKAGGHLRIAGAHGTVSEVFKVVHLGQVVPLDADIETACRELAEGAAPA